MVGLGAMEVGTVSLSMDVGAGLSGVVGGDVSLAMGGAASVSGGRSGSVVFSDGMSVTGGSTVSAAASEGLSLMGRDVDVRGAEGVRVSGAGSVVELVGAGGGGGGGAGEVEYVSFTWRSSSSFTAFSNVVPLVAGAEEVIIRSSVAGGAALASSAGGATGARGRRCGARRWVRGCTRWTVCACGSCARTWRGCSCR